LGIYLRAEALLDDKTQSDLDEEANSLAERMRIGCRELPNPMPLSMFDNVYAGSDERLEEQRRELQLILTKIGEL
jgi:pyruvate dehydrogenase E1 component alpha subunit